MEHSDLDLICGIERDIVERFLLLVKDKYRLADEANYFLELNLGASGINIAITNQRDILSHLCSILTDPSIDYRQKLDHLSTAEEHLRRAITESYERAVSLVLKNVSNIYQEYKRVVLPLKKPNSTLSSAPDMISCAKIFEEIEKKRTVGRRAKARNIWDAEWEKGNKSFLEAFKIVKDLERILEDYIIRAKQIKNNKKQLILTWWSIIATVVTAILGIILSYLLLK